MLLALASIALAAPTYETRVIYAPYDPTRPMAPLRAIVPVQVGAPPPVPPPEPAWVPPPIPVAAPQPVARANMAATADTTSVALENPFAGAREEYLAAANAPPPAENRGVGSGPIKAPAVKPPAPKPCLAARESAGSGVQIEGAGLSGQQIRAAIDAFVPRTAGCIPAGTWGQFTVNAAFSVECSGVVSLVELAPNSGLPPNVTSCLEYALGSAPFPAHDRPGGVSFEIPIVYGGPP